MDWTETHDTLFCREVLLQEPYKFKKGSIERGKKWTEIAEALNTNEEVKFKVTQRGVRERLERLQKKHMEKKKEEESGSGMSVDDMTELETLIDGIIDREKLAEESRDSEGTLKKAEADKKTAVEMRKEAMERCGETRKRSEAEGDQGKQKKRRRSGNDAVEFLKAKTEKENKLRAEEIALRKQEQQQEAARQAQVSKQQNSMLEALQNMQMAMMQQQQQQTTAMMALVERLLPNGS